MYARAHGRNVMEFKFITIVFMYIKYNISLVVLCKGSPTNFITVRTDTLHKAGGGLIRDNITLTTIDILSTINTHNTKLQMVKVHINNTKHITISNMYIPPRDRTITHYKTADTDIQHCIQYITNIPHSVLTGDVNAHSTLWHSYTDDHRGQLIGDMSSATSTT